MKINSISIAIAVGLLLTLLWNCKKENGKNTPTEFVAVVNNITDTSADYYGEISSIGSATITARGVCWSKKQNPTLADFIINMGTGTGSFNTTLTGLAPGVTYYVREFVTNINDTEYSKEVTFTTSSLLPVLTSAYITSKSSRSATCGGNITTNGGTIITACGVCWSLSANPTIKNSKTTERGATGMFTSLITGLSVGNTYYLKAYAINSAGTSYGNELIFVIDADGNLYHTVRIGKQNWMVENLKVTKFRNGDPVLNAIESEERSHHATETYSDYDDHENISNKYGRLYNWYVVHESRNICPSGWHIPNDAEWTTLTIYLGGENVAGGKMKQTDSTMWFSPNTGATNESGFSGIPAGVNRNNTYSFKGSCGYWWSSTEYDSTYAWGRYLFNHITKISRNYYDKSYGFSVRCLSD